MAPAINVDITNFIFVADFWGFVLALPIALFLAFWLSAVKSKGAVVFGAFVGALIGFLAILAWVGTLIFDKPMPNANGAAIFFGSVLLCSAAGLSLGILVDLLIARRRSRDYRRPEHDFAEQH
ncbi:PTS sucrose transporter subunit IIBC [Ktedonosporobacter rubrisoli]|uniref:PTS sucrose transporter subunit IIBC n=2 Tax=Ktedonosporobacter rubrisoli TaxID=2509675 RepID=A0A4P6K7K4_KTERU|nr:PTS sucrose transporter subunit IIBC [Ktedonosporobacter rubrisoli]